MNALESAAANNPARRARQRFYEARWLVRLGGRLDGGRALEIGCRSGYGTQLIIERMGASSVDAVDPGLSASLDGQDPSLRVSTESGSWPHPFAWRRPTVCGIRRDRNNVLPMEALMVHLPADDPWLWAIHLHNICHAEPGKMTVHSYIS